MGGIRIFLRLMEVSSLEVMILICRTNAPTRGSRVEVANPLDEPVRAVPMNGRPGGGGVYLK